MEKIDIEIKDKLGEGNLFKIAPFKEKIKKTRPHKHDGYFELIYLEQAEGFHWVDTDHFQVQTPEIYFLKPGCLHCWQFTSIPRGFVVLFKEAYFDAIREADLVELLHSLQSEARVALPGTYRPTPLFDAMWREFRDRRPYADHVIHGLLRALLSKLKQLLEGQEEAIRQPAALHERFLKLLSGQRRPLPSVRAYAQLLNTSPQNLNAASRKHTGRSAGEHLASHLVLEAKRHLLHTDGQIKEIAYALDFSDASYFVKFFKKHTGQTPGQFRKQYFQ